MTPILSATVRPVARRTAMTLIASALALAGLAIGTSAGLAANLRVAKAGDTSECAESATFHTIQSAVSAAAPGDTIQVCPGTYQEYVYISSGLKNLTLQGMGSAARPGSSTAPVILFPTTPNTQALTNRQADSLVTVDGAQGFDIKGFIVSGPFTDGICEPDTADHYGIYVGGGGQAHIEHDYITNIQNADPAMRGCQDGFGIAVGNSFFFSHHVPIDHGSGHIENDIVDKYQKDGVLIDGGSSAVSSAQIENNTVTGIGPTSQIASNGIEFDDSSIGSIQNNVVSANQYTPPTFQASGILVIQPGANLMVQNNHLSANDIGIYLNDPSANHPVIQSNVIANDTTNPDSEGIQLDDVTNGTVQGNQVSGGNYGIDVFDGTTGSHITGNTVSGVANVGILNQGATPDTVSTVPGPASTGNFYENDTASGSGQFDCKDDTTGTDTAGTANNWQGDHGKTSSPAGICKPS